MLDSTPPPALPLLASPMNVIRCERPSSSDSLPACISSDRCSPPSGFRRASRLASPAAPPSGT